MLSSLQKDFHTRPRAIKHVQYQSTKCLPWLLENGTPVSKDLARSLDAKDAEDIGVERRSGIRSGSTRMPVDTSRSQPPPTVEPAPWVPPRPVELCGYDPIGLEQHIFLDKWSSYDAGPWTTLPVVWGIFAAELKDAYKNCPLSSLESFKSEVCDLVEAVSWRQDDFEVVNVINEQLYEIAKAFYVQQIPRVLPETRFDRLQRMEAQFGSLPAWMGHRDHTQRDTTDGGEERLHIPQKLAALEQGWRSEVALWTSPTESVARPFFKECFYLVFYSGHRRDGDIATQICRLSPDAPRVLLYPICLDLCIDQVRGDLLCPVQQRLWATRMKERKVIGFHASPPCETYADARWLPPPGDAVKPRPLRTWAYPWGLPALDRAEVAQLRIGNVLFYIAIYATLEHPRGSPSDSGRFRIRASSFVERLLQGRGCKLITFNQGPL